MIVTVMVMMMMMMMMMMIVLVMVMMMMTNLMNPFALVTDILTVDHDLNSEPWHNG